MCGISGIFYKEHNFNPEDDYSKILTMCNVMHHRGPDEKNVIIVPSKKGVMGSSRLKIIDLQTGTQPVTNETKDVFVCLNGEIYNYVELREQLTKKGHVFYTRSDTEVIAHLYEEKGEKFVHDLNGMFAISIWDDKRQKLFLVRDRMGEKPLVYSIYNEIIVFASEIKALLLDREIHREISPAALSLFFKYNFIPSPHTIFKNIHKLPPAHMLIWNKGQVSIEKYWDLEPQAGPADSEETAKEKLYHLMEDAVKIRMRSDVPVGVFLSGGMDSSTLSYFTRKAASSNIKYISVSFNEKEFDELPYAQKVAKALRLDHTVILVQRGILDHLSEMTQHMGEPFADSSVLPSYALCKEARKSVTVCLGGDGGDEVFGGYDKYRQTFKGHFILNALKSGKNMLRYANSRFREEYFRLQSIKFFKRAFLRNKDWYLDEISFYNDQERNILINEAFKNHPNEFLDPLYANSPKEGGDLLRQIMYMEIFTTLPDSLLAKVDMASMANSLEVRSPFCDHRIVKYAYGLPLHYKIARNGNTKIILKHVMHDFLPPEIIHRKKAGFVVPLDAWLREKLQDCFEDAFHDPSLKACGILNLDYIQKLFRLHKEGKINRGRSLFSFLVFYLWFRNLRRENL